MSGRAARAAKRRKLEKIKALSRRLREIYAPVLKEIYVPVFVEVGRLFREWEDRMATHKKEGA